MTEARERMKGATMQKISTMKRLFAIVLAAITCFAAGAFADVPVLMNYQGVLMDGSGVAVADGPYSIVFKLYDVPSGGTVIWEETNIVQVSKGTFSVTLGLVSYLGDVPFDMDYYLGLSVSGGEELPRAMLTSAPYSMAARSVIGEQNIFPATGNVGIGTRYPDERLYVAGGIRLSMTTGEHAGTLRWTGSDFQGYDGSVWKSLTSTGGSLPAGTIGQTMRHDGYDWLGSNLLYNDGAAVGIGTTSPQAMLHVAGSAALGSMSESGSLFIHRAGCPSIMSSLNSWEFGGEFVTYDEEGNSTFLVQPDFDGSGGYLSVGRGLGEGFVVDGNSSGTNNPRMMMNGTSSLMFDMNSTGDGSAVLPVDAISSSEMLDEPGIASWGTPYGSELTSSFLPWRSQAIVAPADGYVLAIGSVNVSPWHVTGTETSIILGISLDQFSLPFVQYVWVTIPAGASTGDYDIPAVVSGVFPVSAGSYWFHIVAREASGQGMIYNTNFSLLYVPTAYGDNYIQSIAGPVGDGGKLMAVGAPGAAEMEAARASSEAANADRIQRELDEMQRRIENLEAQLRNAQGGR